ncbi:PA0069 family radical SAM protein [Pseudomonadota bacterium]
MAKKYHQILKGRGTSGNPDNRYTEHQREFIDDGWDNLEQQPAPLHTSLTVDSSRSVICYNQSPDVPVDRSINPYRGCEHGCVYCFARPSHAYLGLSPGLDFETKLFYKPDAATLLRKELSKKRYHCQPIALGINTDAYQPSERELGLTRQILEVLLEFKHPVSIVTKSSLIERDMDILGEMAKLNLVQVVLSIPTLNHPLARTLEPRATAPQRRMKTVQRLAAAGIPVAVFIAPLIPVLTDSEMETIIKQSKLAGANEVGYIMLRLPHELKTLFQDWLQEHQPLKAAHVMARIKDLSGGKEYNAEFGNRMTGTGIYAELMAQRFKQAIKKADFPGMSELDCSLFQAPVANTPQMSLFPL